MNNLLIEALNSYEISQPEVEFIRHNENATYKIKDSILNKKYVLRIHKAIEDFSLEIFQDNKNVVKHVYEEINILNSIRDNTHINIQTPIKNKNGHYVTLLADGTPVTLLTWINGDTIDKVELNEDILFKLGAMVGVFHRFSKKEWRDSENTSLYLYDKMLLKKITHKLIDGVELRIISWDQFEIIDHTIDEISNSIYELDLKKNLKGIVHSDLGKSNIIVSDTGEIVPIDFGLCGISYYYMDLGSLFSHFNKPEQQKNILKGYKSIIKDQIEIKYIETFMVYQIILFIATHIEKAHKLKWFSSAIDRWINEFFNPFNNKIRFLINI
ncbi:phosphotransferase [Clostridium sp. C2-6-12]|uniref:phosphotransferase enzyme family protein n=1 Tax=Clostridium sp. C2-6-12 TaxID=2698832 RepID=UPI001371A778|nr:phosphotransferase [Clostridium sp. C2-6-12]